MTILRIPQHNVNAQVAIHAHSELRNTSRMDARSWIIRGLELPGKTQRGLARALNIDPAGVNRLLKGTRQLRADEVPKAAHYFGEDAPEGLRAITGDTGGEHQDTPSTSASQTVIEIDVRGGMGGGGEGGVEYTPDGNGGLQAGDAVAGSWDFPPEYLRHELRVTPDQTRIIEVQGDSMEPTLRSGDRVMVDLRDNRPTPPGLFCVWDGFGVVVKRIEHIPNTDPPRLRISSDNTNHREYERTAEEVRIIGRIVWFARRL